MLYLMIDVELLAAKWNSLLCLWSLDSYSRGYDSMVCAKRLENPPVHLDEKTE